MLARELPALHYAAARLGSGSDVLGLDDAASRDHDWGCRLTLLVDEADRAVIRAVDDLLSRGLPERFRGLPVRFMTTWNATESHQVEVDTVGGFAASRLGVNPLPGLSALDWLTLTGQSVLEVIAGPVYADTTTELSVVQRTLAWYPPQVERYVLACGWQRLVRRFPMMGRMADTGQPLASRLLSAALASEVMNLAFLLCRQWQPYDKWREAMFTRLSCAGELTGTIETAATAGDWHDREDALAAAVAALAAVQRRRGLPTPDEAVTPFMSRPYRTVAETLPGLLLADITDPMLARLAVRAGSAGQWIDSVDVLSGHNRHAACAVAYRAWLEPSPSRPDDDIT